MLISEKENVFSPENFNFQDMDHWFRVSSFICIQQTTHHIVDIVVGFSTIRSIPFPKQQIKCFQKVYLYTENEYAQI